MIPEVFKEKGKVLDERENLKLILRGNAKWPDEKHPYVVYSLCKEANGVVICNNVELEYVGDKMPDVYFSVSSQTSGLPVNEAYVGLIWHAYYDWDELAQESYFIDDVMKTESIGSFYWLWRDNAWGTGYWLYVAEVEGRRDAVKSLVKTPPPLGRDRYRCAGRSCEICSGADGVEMCNRIELCNGVYRAVVIAWGGEYANLYMPIAAWFGPLPKPKSPEEFTQLWNRLLTEGVHYKTVKKKQIDHTGKPGRVFLDV